MSFPRYPYKAFLVNLLRNVTDLLDKFEVEYVICGGTLLGAIRDKGQIPWDYDADLEILPGSRGGFYDLVKYLEATPKLGIMASYRLPSMVKFTPIVSQQVCRTVGFNQHIPNPTVDCFFQYKRPDGSHQICGDQWPTWYYLKGELRPLRKYYFEDFSMWGPACHNILDRYYGDWRTPRFDKWPPGHLGYPKNSDQDKCPTADPDDTSLERATGLKKDPR